MKNRYVLLGLSAGALLLVFTSCSKQETAPTSAGGNASSASAPTKAPDKTTPAQTPNTPANPAVAAKSDAVVAASADSAAGAPSIAGSAAALTDATNQAGVLAQQTAGNPGAATTPLTSGSNAAGMANSLQSLVPTQSLTLSQAATNDLQALGGGATNRALAALGMTNLGMTNLAGTNQITLSTNQVAALLERAKTLSANQKYQDALATLTQLYNTKLTPDQKQKADELKAQIQASLTQKAASEATSALGNILGGKNQ